MTRARFKNYVSVATIIYSLIGTSFAAMAEEQIALPGEALFPEGIASDAQGGFYVGSLTKGRILYLEPGSHEASVFVKDGSEGLMSVAGLEVSSEGSTLYVCNSDIGVSDFKGASQPGLLAFDTKTGALQGRWDFPDGGLCNDLTLTPNGTLLVTDSFNPRILALNPDENSLSIWSTDERFFTESGFNLNGITWNEQGLFVVKYNTNELFRIDLNDDGSAGAINNIILSRPLGGPDGIETLGSGELLVVEGNTGTLATIRLDGLNGQVKTLAEGLDVPTTAVIFDNIAYVIEAQLDDLPFPNANAGIPDTFMLEAIKLP